eukprot:TRINITY_DN56385_c0_g1_i1.p1 TRINITY_DN56385_c0_g1~~TRINITY_DN56385_c0_g1_i1.p1  ORF type:complete len:1627 (-),score=229.91 TRINITY_DN56385_c0_g1_i1:395-5275(-)
MVKRAFGARIGAPVFSLLANRVASSADQAPWVIHCSTDCGGINTCTSRGLCSGAEVETTICEDHLRLPCPPQIKTGFCKQVDCLFDSWTQWSAQTGDTGLCERERTFRPNACGGNPCTGVTLETKFCLPKNIPIVQDCEFSAWTEWAACDFTLKQHGRVRNIVKQPSANGLVCQGDLSQTEPCGDIVKPVDCAFSQWMPWSGCSRTCGGGQRSRMRAFATKARNGGLPCTGSEDAEMSLTATTSCNAEPCKDELRKVDCKMTSWSVWSECTDFQSQSSRFRKIETPAAYGGIECEEALGETKSCTASSESDTMVNCELGSWGQWSLCSKTCGNGQTHRSRTIEVQSVDGGRPCAGNTAETAPCGEIDCSLDLSQPGNCQLSSWSEWSACSSDCGQGVEKRTRTVVQLAQEGGMGCNAETDELRPCPHALPCVKRDCAWGEWSVWGECDRSCGPGTQVRRREVVTEPTAGGKACESVGETLQMQPCSSGTCEDECSPATWSDWSAWGLCSLSCGGGLQQRNRTVDFGLHPCSDSPTGLSTEYGICMTAPCASDIVDCSVGTWSPWSVCSQTCEGVRERSRPFTPAGVDGQPCNSSSLKEVSSCNGLSDEFINKDACGLGEPRDCKFSDWQLWSECSQNCNGGHRTRLRRVELPHRNGGQLCVGDLTQMEPCQMQPCEASKDCVLADWSSWNGCSGCGGEMLRTRSVQKMPQGGQECPTFDSQETAACSDACEPIFWCAWSEWQVSGGCSQQCGKGSRQRARSLNKLEVEPKDASNKSLAIGFVQGASASCTGLQANPDGSDASIQFDHELCSDLPSCNTCVPVDCEFSVWSPWSVFSESTCVGLCKRTRSVAVQHNTCGAQCEGVLEMTKECTQDGCDGTHDCLYSAWQPWSGCSGGSGQQFRRRSVSQAAGVLGSPCNGTVEETSSCGVDVVRSDCKFSLWSPWGKCSATCGGGQHQRTRVIEVHAAGGKACSGPLVALQACSDIACEKQAPQDCVFLTWSAWFGCDSDGAMQATRVRTVDVEATDAGVRCRGNTKETTLCLDAAPVDCKLSAWHVWGACHATCGAGIRLRTREVEVQQQRGGMNCAGITSELGTCSALPCRPDLDCRMADWSDWMQCSTSCGQGHQQRKRSIEQPAHVGGSGCTDSLAEVRGCSLGVCKTFKDCQWGSWSVWGECQMATHCGVGFRKRSRSVAVQPTLGGKLCEPLPLEEAVPNLACPGSCDSSCHEKSWGDWSEWGSCSSTCGIGIHSRTREVLKPHDDLIYCDVQPPGEASEFESCHAAEECVPIAGAKDCMFAEWGEWNPVSCTSPCNGHRVQRRSIKQHATNGGAPCDGPLEESVPCNPSPGQAYPNECAGLGLPLDCLQLDWEGWSPCSSQCGPGYKSRSRMVVHPPSFGGLNCSNPIRELRMCEMSPCTAKDAFDCKWNDWSSWSHCNAINGEQYRTRNVKSPKLSRGKDCDGPSQQVQACASRCASKPHTCSWSDWGLWSTCSWNCSRLGRRTRQRSLVVSLAEAVELAPIKEFDLQSQSGSGMVVAKRARQLHVAFAYLLGIVTSAAIVGVLWKVGRRGSSLSSRKSFSTTRESPLELLDDYNVIVQTRPSENTRPGSIFAAGIPILHESEDSDLNE